MKVVIDKTSRQILMVGNPPWKGIENLSNYEIINDIPDDLIFPHKNHKVCKWSKKYSIPVIDDVLLRDYKRQNKINRLVAQQVVTITKQLAIEQLIIEGVLTAQGDLPNADEGDELP